MSHPLRFIALYPESVTVGVAGNVEDHLTESFALQLKLS